MSLMASPNFSLRTFSIPIFMVVVELGQLPHAPVVGKAKPNPPFICARQTYLSTSSSSKLQLDMEISFSHNSKIVKPVNQMIE